MANEVQSVSVDLSPILKSVREERGLTQRELADRLGVSQSYVSRLEGSERRPHRLDLLSRISSRLDIPPEHLGIAPQWIEDSEAEHLYETALVLIGASEVDTAIDLLSRVRKGGRGIVSSELLTAKATQRLADLKRDRFEVSGPDGAIQLYQQALAVFESVGARSSIREINFVIGACFEMLGRLDLASTQYELVVQMAQSHGSLQGEARAENRLGVVLTKSGELEEAERRLERARHLALDLDDPFPYTFASEKTAILRLQQGKFDDAHRLAINARSDINPGDPLRLVQNHLVTADIALSAEDPGEGIADLATARSLALDHEFRHQLQAIDRLLAKHGA